MTPQLTMFDFTEFYGYIGTRTMGDGGGDRPAAEDTDCDQSRLGGVLGRFPRSLQLHHPGDGPNLVAADWGHPVLPARSPRPTTLPVRLAVLPLQSQPCRLWTSLWPGLAVRPSPGVLDAGLGPSHCSRHLHPPGDLRHPFPLALFVVWMGWNSMGEHVVPGSQLHHASRCLPAVFQKREVSQTTADWKLQRRGAPAD